MCKAIPSAQSSVLPRRRLSQQREEKLFLRRIAQTRHSGSCHDVFACVDVPSSRPDDAPLLHRISVLLTACSGVFPLCGRRMYSHADLAISPFATSWL